MKNYVKGTFKPKTADRPEKGGPSPDNNDGTRAAFPGEDGAVHMIFGDLRQDHQGGVRSSSREKYSTPTSRNHPI
jgi:hypothetical protein